MRGCSAVRIVSGIWYLLTLLLLSAYLRPAAAGAHHAVQHARAHAPKGDVNNTTNDCTAVENNVHMFL